MSQGKKNTIYSRHLEVAIEDVSYSYFLNYLNSFLIRIKILVSEVSFEMTAKGAI